MRKPESVAATHHLETFHQLEEKQVRSWLPRLSHQLRYISATKATLLLNILDISCTYLQGWALNFPPKWAITFFRGKHQDTKKNTCRRWMSLDTKAYSWAREWPSRRITSSICYVTKCENEEGWGGDRGMIQDIDVEWYLTTKGNNSSDKLFTEHK